MSNEVLEDIQSPTLSDDIDIADLTAVLEICRRLSPSGRRRLIETITTFYGVQNTILVDASPVMRAVNQSFTIEKESREISPKEFILQKQPQTGVERMACLAYYLTHYRETPHFKTLELSKLNTEAAQPKFTNPTLTSNDAQKMGYLISVSKGDKQLSAAGELFVQALPDREAARAAMAAARPRRRVKRTPGGRKSGNEVNFVQDDKETYS